MCYYSLANTLLIQSKQRRRRRKYRSMQRSTTLPSLQPPLGNQHNISTHTLRDSTIHNNIIMDERVGSHTESVPYIHESTWRGRLGSKCSDGGSKRAPQDQQTNGKQQTWRFVNRYAHRSSGGIPIFSEERLKERAKKVWPHSTVCVHMQTKDNHLATAPAANIK